MTEPTKAHGNVGNQHAKKEDKAESQIQIRVPRSVKAGYVKRAQKEGLKLTAWIQKKCDAAD